MINRRKFIKLSATAGLAACVPSIVFPQPEQNNAKTLGTSPMIWANLLHLSYNMWEDTIPEKYREDDYNCQTCQEAREWAHGYRSSLTFDESMWEILLDEMANARMNMVVIDLGDAVLYDSHPEIAVKNAWSPYKLRKELERIRNLGIEPIPKLNFAAHHDAWLGEYARMVSTTKYYSVCRDLINEVIDIFDSPRFFHLGMDEEDLIHGSKLEYKVLRQHDLWWRDLYFFIGETEKRGVRAWIWSDYACQQPEQFFNKMPKSVLQSNWFYGSSFNLTSLNEINKNRVELFYKLEEHGYDQVPTGSNHSNNVNLETLVEYCKQKVASSRLKGFMTVPWRPTLPQCLENHKEAIEQVGRAIKNFK